MYTLPGLLRGSLLRSSLGGGLGMLNSTMRRSYHSYDTLLLPPSLRPDSIEAAKKAATSQLLRAYDLGFFNAKLDSSGSPILRIVSGSEFGYNGYVDHTGKYKYDASRPITIEMYKAMLDVFAQYTSQMDPSVIFCPGTAIVDTGQTSTDGKPIIENRSFLGAGTNGLDPSESKGNVVEFSKSLWSNIDAPDMKGLEQAFTLEMGTGPTLVSVKDFTGGRDAVIGLAICLDISRIGKDIVFPIEPQVVLNPSAGSPIDAPIGPAEVVVPDTLRLPFDSDGIDFSKTYTPKSGMELRYPKSKAFIDGIETVTGRGEIAQMMRDVMMKFISDPMTTYDAFNRYEAVGFRVEPSSVGNEVVVVDERPLPTIDETLLDNIKKAAVNANGQITILFPQDPQIQTGPDVPPPPDAGEGPTGFDPNEEEFQTRVDELYNLHLQKI